MPYIEQFHRIKSGSKILEIGCGEGGNLLPFAQRGCEVVGIDMSLSRIQQAQHFSQKYVNCTPKVRHKTFGVQFVYEVWF